MKRVIISIFFITIIFSALGKDANLPLTLKQIAAEKNENKRIDIIYELYAANSEINPQWSIVNAQKVYELSQINSDFVSQAMAKSTQGASYRLLGNTAKGLECHLAAMAIADRTSNAKLKAYINVNMGNIYRDRNDFDKAIAFYNTSIKDASDSKSYEIQSWNYGNLGIIYLKLNKLDSALIYSQRAYEICTQYKYHRFLSDILSQLGGIQSKMKNEMLAISYYDLAIKEAVKLNKPRYLNWAYTGLAQHYYNNNNKDSCLVFAKKAIDAVTRTPFKNMAGEPAKLVYKVYEKINCDSSIKYAELFWQIDDDIFSANSVRKTELLTFEEELRQKEITATKMNADALYKKQIQYGLLGITIFVFLILYLLLSRSLITNAKVIDLLGVIVLLLVFEFLNILLHSLLAKITHHLPLYVLLANLIMAAILAPLHHNLEKWTTTKLIERNKRIRLAEAKKTIEELEK